MRLLITAAGTGTGFGYAQAKARRFPGITLLTGDIHPAEQVTASLFAERHLILPPTSEEIYFSKLHELLCDWSVDIYIPLIDTEVAQAAIAIERHVLPVTAACNSAGFCQAATAKSSYDQWFNAAGVSTLKPLSHGEIRNHARVVAKRDGGFGGRATRIVEAADEIDGLLQENWSMYPYIEGDEFTVDCFPLGDQVMTSIRQRLEVKSGVCTKARIGKEDVLTEWALHVCRSFALNHPFCFQTRKADGIHYLIDINPRLGAGTTMSALNGMDFFAAHLAYLSGQEPRQFLRPRFDQCVVTRQYCDYLMSATS